MNRSIKMARRVGLLTCVALSAFTGRSLAETFSLSGDFSAADNSTNSTWSYRMDDRGSNPSSFPLLTVNNRDANEIWGSTFPTPPRMWSDESGYWGIGRNDSGEMQFSSLNDTRWEPGEVLFHPSHGNTSAGLVVCWTAPENMEIDVHYKFAAASPHGNGIGYQIIVRSGRDDSDIVALENIGTEVIQDLYRLVVSKGDQLLFRFHTCGDAVGDITLADIVITSRPVAEPSEVILQPFGGKIAEGTHIHLLRSSDGRWRVSMVQEWRAYCWHDRSQLPHRELENFRRWNLFRPD